MFPEFFLTNATKEAVITSWQWGFGEMRQKDGMGKNIQGEIRTLAVT